jgi:signal transduction histidine kinase/DNA-binding NarL/FixJ family response regulator
MQSSPPSLDRSTIPPVTENAPDRLANLALGMIVLAATIEVILLGIDVAGNLATPAMHYVTITLLVVIMLTGLGSFTLLRRRIGQLEDLSRNLAATLREKEAAVAANLVKARYLANVSHEIRSPLNAIYGYAQLVEFSNDIDPQHAARVIRRCSEHITSLTESLLDISQLENGLLRVRSEPVAIGEFIDQIGWMMRPAAEAKGLQFFVELPQNLPELVRTDPGRLRQALINLTGNAIKFTERGSVTLRVTYRSQVARFSIEDTGPGIPPEDQQRIFEPYEQLDRPAERQSASGFGLGLAITKAIIEILGGKLEVASTPGAGSCFTATLMLPEPAKALSPEATSRKIAGYEGTGRSILVTDDEEDQRSLLQHFLTDCGFDVATAASGLEAIALCDERNFDLVLLDISMPGMSGWEAAEQIRAKLGRGVQIAMASANVQEFHKPDYDRPSHDHFFIKPYRLDDLAKTVGAMLGIAWKWSPLEPSGSADAPAPTSVPARAAVHVQQLRERIHIGHVRGIEAEIAMLAQAAPDHGRLITALYAALDEFDLARLLRLLEDI